MHQRLPIITAILVTVLTVALFALGGHFTAVTLVGAQQERQLNELAELVLRRAESSIQFATQALDDLEAKQLVGCNDSILQSIRFEIYRHGALKDIRVARPTGAVQCSAFPETLEFDRTWAERADMLPSTDGAYDIFRVDQFNQTAIGVLKDIDAEHSLIAILALNPALLDVMPDELRNNSNIAVELVSGSRLAQLRPDEGVGSITPITSFSASSDIYPFMAELSIDTPALERWNQEIYWPIVGLVAALGLSIGLMWARHLIRPESPVVAIDRAIAAREFKPFLQPIFDLETGGIVGAEMLARWVRPDGQIIPPARFIKLAEESGRIEQMTWQLLSSALEELHPLLSANKNFTMSLNVTPHHFMQPGFAHDLRTAVTAARVSYRQICVEITEREPFDDLDAAAKIVSTLQGYGFKLALDDVGIGHSGLSHLQGLGANTIKIDKFFVDTVGRDATANSIIQMLVRLARELDMGLVAEGIESADQITALLECGVQRGQGYVVSPPVAISSFLDLAAANRAATNAKQLETNAA